MHIPWRWYNKNAAATFSANLSLLWIENKSCRLDGLSAELCEYRQNLIRIIFLLWYILASCQHCLSFCFPFYPFSHSRSQSYQRGFRFYLNSLPRIHLKIICKCDFILMLWFRERLWSLMKKEKKVVGFIIKYLQTGIVLYCFEFGSEQCALYNNLDIRLCN